MADYVSSNVKQLPLFVFKWRDFIWVFFYGIAGLTDWRTDWSRMLGIAMFYCVCTYSRLVDWTYVTRPCTSLEKNGPDSIAWRETSVTER